MYRRRKNKLQLFLAGLVFILLSPSSLADSGLSVRPVNDYEACGGCFRYELMPGDFLTDEFIVVNNTDEEMVFEFHAVDTFFDEDGARLLHNGGSSENVYFDEWVDVEPQVILPPGGVGTYSFDLRIPEDIPHGDYEGGVTVTMMNSLKDDEGISINYRLGMYIFVKVTDDPIPVPFEHDPYVPFDITIYLWLGALVSGLGLIAILYILYTDREK